MTNQPPSSKMDPFALLEDRLRQAQNAEDGPRIVRALVDLGQAYLQQGDPPKALTQFDAGLEAAKKYDVSGVAAHLHMARGAALERIGSFDFALKAFRRGLKLAEMQGIKPLIGEGHYRMGLMWGLQGEADKSLQALQTALDVASESRNAGQIVRIQRALGNAYAAHERFEESLQSLQEARSQAQGEGMQAMEAALQLEIGLLHQHRGNDAEAIRALESTLTLADALEDPTLESLAMRQLMGLHLEQDNLDLACMYADRWLERYRETEEPLIALAGLEEFGNRLIGAGHYETSQRYLQSGLDLAQSLDDKNWQMRLAMSLGLVAQGLENHAQARDHYQTALDIARKQVDVYAQATILGRLGVAEAELGELENSRSSLENALTLAEPLDASSLRAELRMLLAFTLLDLDRRSEAIEISRAALADFDAAGDQARVHEIQTLLEQLGAF